MLGWKERKKVVMVVVVVVVWFRVDFVGVLDLDESRGTWLVEK